MRSPFDCLELQSPFFKAASAAAPPDTTAPVVNSFTVGPQNISGLPIAINNNPDASYPLTLYVVGIPAGDPEMTDKQKIIDGQDQSGAAATITNTTSYSATSSSTDADAVPDGLDGNYDFYGVLVDAAGNRSDIVSDLTIAVDSTDPTLSSAVLAANGTTLTLTYNETLAGTADTADYTVEADAVGVSVSTATRTGATVVIELASAINSGQTVTVDFDAAGEPITDAFGNPAAALTDQAVTNNSTQGGATNILATQSKEWTDAGVWRVVGNGVSLDNGTGILSWTGTSQNNLSYSDITSGNRVTGLSAGVNYEVSADVINYNTGGNVRFEMSWYDSGGGSISTVNGSNITISGAGNISAQFTSPASTEQLIIRVKCRTDGIVFDMENISLVVV